MKRFFVIESIILKAWFKEYKNIRIRKFLSHYQGIDKNVELAFYCLKENLRFIFFDSNRIKLVFFNGRYRGSFLFFSGIIWYRIDDRFNPNEFLKKLNDRINKDDELKSEILTTDNNINEIVISYRDLTKTYEYAFDWIKRVLAIGNDSRIDFHLYQFLSRYYTLSTSFRYKQKYLKKYELSRIFNIDGSEFVDNLVNLINRSNCYTAFYSGKVGDYYITVEKK